VKISTTVPSAWVEELCALMPAVVAEAAGRAEARAPY
jgi:hypothetical protein